MGQTKRRAVSRGLFLWVGVLGLVAGCIRGPVPSPARPALLAGISGDYPPFSDWKQEHPSGFSVALVEAFAADQGLEPSWVRFPWSGLVTDLSAGKFDLADGGITVRPERSVAGRYTVPLLRNGAVLLLRRPVWAPPAVQAPPLTVETALAEVRALDRPELRVAVNRGGHLERVARSLFRHAQIQTVPDNAVRETLAAGEADAALSNTVEAPRWAEGLAGIELLGPLTRDVVAVYVRPDREELATQLDAWLMAQEASGALGTLRARYLGPGAGERTALPLPALLAATAERLALMPLVAAAKQRVGQPVEDTSQEARVRASFRADVAQAARAAGVAPPPDEALDAFCQAQIDAAKLVQQHTPPASDARAYSLETELRPAVARISAKMSTLVVRLPPGLEQATVLEQARDWLGASGLEPPAVERLARTLAALSPHPEAARP
ncbi:transporter substrate-binding domain-containing protein [Stigmatella sp. ncwal1]|uniref:chorismate mutase n=1 Tax=Stigmatella ashevillensis TaxID=2995309 RepID=A0ABT5DGF1_9BACT|nr:transporter substrate-binding domain-containing protein [Stigmatella ashevillena]MDC0711858.1 transporter substrate-binding domain-containing protein [Stigmatella ashevillena]